MELRLIIHRATDRRSSGRRTEGRFTEKKIKREKGRENEAERKRGKERDRKRNKTACRYICMSLYILFKYPTMFRRVFVVIIVERKMTRGRY